MRLIYSDSAPAPNVYEPLALTDLASGDDTPYTASARLCSNMSGRYALLPVRITSNISHPARNMCKISLEIVDADCCPCGSHDSLFVGGKLCQVPPLPLLSLAGSLVDKMTFYPYAAYLDLV